MNKKKKMILIVGVILVVVIGLIGKYQYDQYQAKENRNLSEVALVFMIADPKDKNLIKSNYTNAELKNFIKNPPKIEINTGAGLGLKVSAYNYYNNVNVDAYTIQELVESGKFHEAYEYSASFIHWSKNNPNEILNYQNAVNYASVQMGEGELDPTITTYKDYLDIINSEDGQKYMDEYFTSIGE